MSLRVVLAVAAALAACGARTDLGAARGGDASCETREITIQVSSLAPWTDTGIDVDAGAEIRITASGTVHYGGLAEQVTDANGGNFDGQKFFSTAVLPSAVVCSLIGRIGDAPVPEGTPGDGAGFVGVSYDEIAPASGRLFLGFNDQKQAFGDNSGAFSVTIRLGC